MANLANLPQSQTFSYLEDPAIQLYADRIMAVARTLAEQFARERTFGRGNLRKTMEKYFGGSDQNNCWSWRDVTDAVEVAQVLYYKAELSQLTEDDRLRKLELLQGLIPTSRHRTEESELHQHFSTPMILSEVASKLLAIAPHHHFLEPSAGFGTGTAPAARITNNLCLNEISARKLALLDRLFPEARLFGVDAGSLDDRLDHGILAHRMFINPPFNSSPGQRGLKGIGVRHIMSAVDRLAEGGRMVAVTPAGFTPENQQWSLVFAALSRKVRIECLATLFKGMFQKSGTPVATNLLVLSKEQHPTDTSLSFKRVTIEDIDELVFFGKTNAPTVSAADDQIQGSPAAADKSVISPNFVAKAKQIVLAQKPFPKSVELDYEPLAQQLAAGHLQDQLYEPYEIQSVRLDDAPEHPTALVQSAALASVAMPIASYKPHVPHMWRAKNMLSGPQLETTIYAGQAHQSYLAGTYAVSDDGVDLVYSENGFKVRQGYAIGDGTGTGKGREIASIIFDNFARGRRKAIWLTKSDKLIKAARRDWEALGCDPNQIVNLSKFKPGEAITLDEGIIFATYARGRNFSHKYQVARIDQLLEWVGDEFDGVIAMDECHELANAAPGKSDFMDMESKASLQGKFGLQLQTKLPEARVVYASATIATKVESLSFACRLGLWGTHDLPFASREDFMSSMSEGGISALEVVSRDLKAAGLYIARSLSFEGVAYEMVEHELTPDQVATYNAFADAYKIIHANLQSALQETNIVDGNKALNAMAKGAALSAFESTKQRLFNHLLTSMATAAVIDRMEEDLNNGHACVVQIISTGEAVMKRRLAQVAPEDRYDLQFDVTPREYILDYLMNSFPVVLHEVHKDDEGRETAVPSVDEKNNIILCRKAVERRDILVERLCSLPPVRTALDQIVHHFGTANVAEVTGRTQRIVKKEVNGVERRILQTRSAGSNIAEEQAFNADMKRLIVFSEAGGTGSSYHADLTYKNQRQRRHYLLEAGWRAELAIQGLGRSHRSNQAQTPTFLPVTTNVQGQKRFTSTIAKRLDALGALTKGQRQTGGQGLFRPQDNLESSYAKAALIQFYTALYLNKIPDITLAEFSVLTGLDLIDGSGELKTKLPPIQRFLNRLLALRIDEQNSLFAIFETFIEREIEAAKKAGTYDAGLMTLQAHKITTLDTNVIYRHPRTGAETMAIHLERVQRIKYRTYDYVDEKLISDPESKLVINLPAGNAAVLSGAFLSIDEEFNPIHRHRLYGPCGTKRIKADVLQERGWVEAEAHLHKKAWEDELSGLPEFETDHLFLLTGSLMPLWKKLPAAMPKVVRLQTDTGMKLLGRVLNPTAYDKLLIELDKGRPDSITIIDMIMSGDAEAAFDKGFRLRRSKVMDRYRLEVVGDFQTELATLKQLGCFTEIMQYQARCFIQTDENAAIVLDRMFERYALKAITSLA